MAEIPEEIKQDELKLALFNAVLVLAKEGFGSDSINSIVQKAHEFVNENGL